MISYFLFIFLSVSFFGYIIGRIADNYFNIWIRDPSWIPDHWILGFVMMLLGIFWFTESVALYSFSFGFGHLISDLNDFLRLKFYGSDNKNKEDIRFWDID